MNKENQNKMIRHLSTQNIFMLSLLCATIIAFLVSLSVLITDLPFVRKNCSDFSSAKEAQDAFDRGQKGLDRNNDWIPCNALTEK